MRTTRKQFPVKLVVYRKTRFHYSARQSEVESANEKMVAYVEGLWVDKLSYFNEKHIIETD